ncbi:hypothetical protein JTE90_017535 [Oedothorax gibbosus]|uniref:Uncharacterized protein n=1 Tax=Oedothorax gibbosus TaxID=931172 RepID=A0AAV6TRD2_9ARAC|nr:hypothetical protein JTE90_017535 [Oedothorax gibbosus]
MLNKLAHHHGLRLHAGQPTPKAFIYRHVVHISWVLYHSNSQFIVESNPTAFSRNIYNFVQNTCHRLTPISQPKILSPLF